MTSLRQVSKRITAARDEALCKAILSGKLTAKEAAARYGLADVNHVYVILHRARKRSCKDL